MPAKRSHDRHLADLNRATTGNARELARILVKARGRVQAAILSRASDPALARSLTARKRLFADVAGVYGELNRDLTAFEEKAVKTTAENWHQLAAEDIGVRVSSSAVTRFSAKHVQDYFELIHPKNINRLVASQWNPQISTMLGSDVRQLRTITVDVLREASISGATGREIEKEMLKQLADAGRNLDSWKFISANGAQWTPRNYFNMLTRTLTNTVARESYLDTMADAGYDLATLEGGGDPCKFCSPWRGQIFSISGADSRYPSKQDLMDHGVWHPNCTCYASYIDETVDSKMIKEQAGSGIPDGAISTTKKPAKQQVTEDIA